MNRLCVYAYAYANMPCTMWTVNTIHRVHEHETESVYPSIHNTPTILHPTIYVLYPICTVSTHYTVYTTRNELRSWLSTREMMTMFSASNFGFDFSYACERHSQQQCWNCIQLKNLMEPNPPVTTFHILRLRWTNDEPMIDNNKNARKYWTLVP